MDKLVISKARLVNEMPAVDLERYAYNIWGHLQKVETVRAKTFKADFMSMMLLLLMMMYLGKGHRFLNHIQVGNK